MTQIQLSVEEALEYQKFDEYLSGFQSGVNLTLDHLRRRKIESIVKSRPAATPPEEKT